MDMHVRLGTRWLEPALREKVAIRHLFFWIGRDPFSRLAMVVRLQLFPIYFAVAINGHPLEVLRMIVMGCSCSNSQNVRPRFRPSSIAPHRSQYNRLQMIEDSSLPLSLFLSLSEYVLRRKSNSFRFLMLFCPP